MHVKFQIYKSIQSLQKHKIHFFICLVVLESCVYERLKVFRILWKKYGVLFALGSFSFHFEKKKRFTVIFTTYEFSSCCDGNCVIINSVHDKYNVLPGHTCRSTQSSLSMISFGSWRSWCSSITCVKKNENCQWRDQRGNIKKAILTYRTIINLSNNVLQKH